MGVSRSSITSFASRLVKSSKVGSIKIFVALVCEVASELCKIVLDTEQQLTFAKFQYLMGDIFRQHGMFFEKRIC